MFDLVNWDYKIIFVCTHTCALMSFKQDKRGKNLSTLSKESNGEDNGRRRKKWQTFFVVSKQCLVLSLKYLLAK